MIADTGGDLILGRWPGAQLLAPTTWIDWRRTADADVRRQALPNLARGRWDLAAWTWTRTTLVTQLRAGTSFSVNRYVEPGQPSTPWCLVATSARLDAPRPSVHDDTAVRARPFLVTGMQRAGQTSEYALEDQVVPWQGRARG